MRPLTNDEAAEVLEVVFNLERGSLEIAGRSVEATVFDYPFDEVQADIQGYCEIIGALIDPDTITVTEDHDDETNLDLVRVTIRTEYMS